MLRLARLAAQLAPHSVQALLVTHLEDVRWLTGFTGSNAAVVVPASRRTKPVLFTDGRYTQQAREETRGARVVIAKNSVLREVCAWMLAHSMDRCGFDPEHTTVAALEILRQAVPARQRRSFFRPLPPITATLREIKDSDEIARMRRAALLGCHLFEQVLTHIHPGAKEVEIAAHLEFAARSAGAEAMSFDTIVAAGARSALPHGHASSQRLPRRGFVVLDFGVKLNGYCSDMTRTVHLGPATRVERAAYDAVLEAQLAAVAAVRPGVHAGDIDEAARSVLRRAKLAEHFTHSTGHGVGLEIHEGPRIAARQQQPLASGMVITIEPGIYLPGKFGIRIEDMVLVTRTGGEILTPTPKALIEL